VPNTTGADRTAVIAILCEGTEITITVTQRATKEDGTEPAPVPPMEELINLSGELYNQVCSAWMQIDGNYSTHTSRLSLTPGSSFLFDFWQKSYECIHYSNLLIEQLGTYSNMSEADKSLYRGKGKAYRATAYFYLKSLFGGTPLTLTTETAANSIPRASEQEMNDAVRADFEAATETENIPVLAADSVRLLLSIHALQISDFIRAKNLLEGMRNNGLYSFRDINGDDIINADDRDAQIFVQILLLSAEASVNLENNMEATQLVNILCAQLGMMPLLSQGATQEEIRAAIRSLFTAWNDGLKFLNVARWGDTEIWGSRALMPIPSGAMETNPNLVQNPGY
jgi:hypothetical protein